MRIAIDIRIAQLEDSSRRGFGYFTNNLLDNILILLKQNYDIYLVGYDSTENWIKKYKYIRTFWLFNIFSSRLISFIFNKLNYFFIYSWLEEKFLYYYLKKEKIDILFTFSSGILTYKFRKKLPCKIIKVFYDAIPILFKEQYLIHKRNYKRYLKYLKSFENTNGIVTISDNSKNDLLKYIKYSTDKILVFYPGVSSNFRPYDFNNLQIVKRKYHIVDKYLFYVGGFDSRKNVKNIIKSFDILCKKNKFIFNNYQLVLGGRFKDNFEYKNITGIVPNYLKKKIIFPGFIKDDELPKLYAGADIFIFPSLYEGFGISVIEAMACGSPVITSNSSSLFEIAQNKALTVNPKDVNEIANAIEKIIFDSDLKTKLSRGGLSFSKNFSWISAAQKVVNYIEKI